MDRDIKDSVVIITSDDRQNSAFGTGFVVYDDGAAFFIVTCAHVIHDVGGPQHVLIEGLRAAVIATGEQQNIDLALLQVEGMTGRLALGLQAIGAAGSPVEVVGFYRDSELTAVRVLHGQLNGEILLHGMESSYRPKAWDLNISGNFLLRGGYSGSPVIDPRSGNVLAIASYRIGDGDKGIAISVVALTQLLGLPAGIVIRDSPVAAAPYLYLSPNGQSDTSWPDLHLLIRLRGLRVWPDRPGRRISAALLREQVNAASGAVLYLSSEYFDDEILSHEIDAILERCANDVNFPVVALLDGVSTAAANIVSRRIRGLGRPIELNADSALRAAQLRGIADDLLADVLTFSAERVLRNTIVTVGLFSWPPAGNGTMASLRLDWQPLFKQLPSDETWRTKLLPALEALRRVLGDAGIQTIRLYPKAHLSVGIAFGYVFRAPTTITIELEQAADVWWSSSGDVVGPLLEVIPQTIDGAAGEDTTIEIEIIPGSPDVRTVVQQCITRNNLPIRKRIYLAPKEGASRTFIHDGAHARALAEQIERVIIREHSGGTLHLFGTMPIGLSVLLGMRLNARGRVQCYEYDRNTNGYKAACLLGSR